MRAPLLLVALLLGSAAALRADEVEDARRQLQAGDHQGAIARLQDLARARPGDARVQRELGFALLLGNQEAAAVEALERARLLDPTDLEVLVQLARALTALQRVDAAIEAWDRAALRGPRHPVGWRSVAQLLLHRAQKGDRERALRALELGTRECPEDEQLLLLRAEALLVGGQEAEVAQARGLLEAFAKGHPAALETSRRLAALQAALGDFAGAEARLRELLPRAPQDGAYRDLLEAELAMNAWEATRRAGPAPPALDAAAPGMDPSLAARRLDLLLRARVDDGALLVARARVELRRDDAEAALPWLERAALVGPEGVTADALLLQEVAHARLKAGKEPPRTYFGPGASPAKARRLAWLAGWLPAAHETLGRALEREGDLPAAAEAYEAAAARSFEPAEQDRLRTLAAAARATEERRKRNAGM